MDRERVAALLRDVADGDVGVEDALASLVGDHPSVSDGHRRGPDGVTAIRGTGRTVGQLVDVTTAALASRPDRPVLVTRIGEDVIAALVADFDEVDADPLARAARVGPAPQLSDGSIAVVCSGTTDLPIAAEAAFSAAAFGLAATMVTDADAPAFRRVVDARPVLRTVDCLVVVGRGGALSGAAAEILSTPIVAVPTAGHPAALDAYPPGVSLVAADDGFGAAVCAWRVARAAHRAFAAPSAL